MDRAIATAAVGGRPIAVTGSNDHAVRIWDLTHGTLIHPPMREHRDRVYAVACTRLDGTPVAVTGGDDDLLRLWDLTTGRAIGTPLAGHGSWISAVVCTEADGRSVAISGSFDRTVRVWDLDTGQCAEVLVMPTPVWALDVAPDGGLVVCTGQDVLVLDQLGKGPK
ncbi:WD40 repeat domain-containing protein [Amycolatopsis sp. NPDC004378]